MLNVYEQVDKNKRKSWIIVLGFILFVVSAVWIIGQAFGSGPVVIVFAAVFALFSSLGSYFWGDKLILSLSSAKPANRKDHFNFYTTVENLSIASQMPLPKLYVINSPAMNAFATGRDPKHAVVCATTGLLENLNRSELEAVVAHELSHIKNYDIRLMTIVAILAGMLAIISDWIIRISWFRGDDQDRSANPILIIGGIVALILAPIAAKLIQLAISRRREFLADVSAVKLTRQPGSLINALKKLGTQKTTLKKASTATAHLYIVNPFKNSRHRLVGLFSTHPPIEKRIANLEKML